MGGIAGTIIATTALVVSGGSLLVAWKMLGIARSELEGAHKALATAHLDLRTARQVEVQAMLHTAERLFVEYPDLLLAFRSSAQSQEEDARQTAGQMRRSIDARLADQIDIMILMCLNVFEAAYDVFCETGPASRWESWQRTIAEFLEDCTYFAKSWKHYGPQYDEPFRNFIDSEVARITSGAADAASGDTDRGCSGWPQNAGT